MKIDFNQDIKGLDGKVVINPETGMELTLAVMAETALVSSLLDRGGQPENLDGMTKARFGRLAQSIFEATGFVEPEKRGAVEIPVEDIATIKDRIGRGYGAIAVMRAWELLEAGNE